MCLTVVYHCETPVAEPWRPSYPLPQAGRRDRGEPSADGASSVSLCLSTRKEEVERALEVGLAPGPHHRCQEKAEALVKPCWEGAGPEQVQSQPLDPLCQHLGSGARALFLSSLLLIHTLERCCGVGGVGASSTSLHPATNPGSQHEDQPWFCSCIVTSSQKEQNSKKKKAQSSKHGLFVTL